jgi:protein-disulfide isomerase
MKPTRRDLGRHLLAAGGLAATRPLLPRHALAQAANPPAAPAAPDPRMDPREEGSATAKDRVEEWFSFTCPHCAAFAQEVFPDVKTKLIDTGKLLYVFREFPRDKLDLMAAMVARSLPVSRYEPFMMALFATQAHWAFTTTSDPKDELAKMAALAGMPRETFDRVTADEGLQQALLDARTEAEEKYKVDSTPTFIVNGKSHSGEMTYDRFAALVTA